MRALAISALLAMLATLAPTATAAANPVWIHPEPKECVTDPCEQYYCDTLDESVAGVHHERFRNCQERFSVDFIDCLFGEHWEYVVNTPLLVVRYSACNTPA